MEIIRGSTMASIIVTLGKQEGNFWPLGNRTTVVGRDETVPVQILDDLVSRKHMQIRFDRSADTYAVIDMNSSNGVYINNQKIDDETLLAEGDVISIGQTVLLFTEKNFEDRESAISHYKKVGEKVKVTMYKPNTQF